MGVASRICHWIIVATDVCVVAAVLLRERRALDAEIGALFPEVAGESRFPVPLDDSFVKLLLSETDTPGLEFQLLFGELEIHGANARKHCGY